MPHQSTDQTADLTTARERVALLRETLEALRRVEELRARHRDIDGIASELFGPGDWDRDADPLADAICIIGGELNPGETLRQGLLSEALAQLDDVAMADIERRLGARREKPAESAEVA